MTDRPRPAIVTIGNFDGMHRGHQKLIQQVTDRAHALGLGSLAVTFEPHPEQILFPERRLNHLSSAEERIELLHAAGIDDVWVCPFTTELSRMEPEDFMRLVADRRPIEELWVGSDFALGRGRRGTIAVLADLGGALGWGLHMVPPYHFDGRTVSSTAIRTLLGAGAVHGAADLLGRGYSVRGVLEHNELTVHPMRALPRPAAYEARVYQDGRVIETPVTVLPNPKRIRIDHQTSLHTGSAVVEFADRGA
jgi:riboflavin kinase/FMN adenylyltransferase